MSHENRILALEEDSAQMRGHRSIELICEKVLQSCSAFSMLETVPKMHRQDLLPFNFLLRQEYAALQRAYITLRSDAEIVLQSLTDPSTASEEVIQLQSNLQASRLPKQWCGLIPYCGAFEGLSIAPWLARLQFVPIRLRHGLLQR